MDTHQIFQGPRSASRQRVANLPHVDVLDHGSSGELVLTIHVKTGTDQSHLPNTARVQRPVGFRRAIAAAVLAVVDELMPTHEVAAARAAAAGEAGEVAEKAPAFPEARVGDPGHQRHVAAREAEAAAPVEPVEGKDEEKPDSGFEEASS